MRELAEKTVKWGMRLSLVLSAITLCLYSYLGKDVRMIADDYCTAYRGALYGMWDGFLNVYQTWAANYTNAFLVYGASAFQPEIHRWLGLINVVFWTIAFIYLIWQGLLWIKFPQALRTGVFVGVLMSFVMFRILPSYQHVWWLGAVFRYTWSMILMTLLFASLLHYWRLDYQHWRFILMMVYTIILVFVIAGFVESSITLLTAIFGIALFLIPYIEAKRRIEWFVLVMAVLIVCAGAMLFSLTSPGSYERRNAILTISDSPPPSLLETFINGNIYTILYLFAEPFGFAFGQTVALGFLGFLFAILFFMGLGVKNYQFPAPKRLGLSALFVLLLAYIFCLSVIWPVYYSATVLVIRPLIAARFVQVFMVIAWAYIAIVAAQRLHLEQRLRQSKVFPIVVILVAFLMIWTPSFSIYRLLEIAPDMEAYADSWDERHQYLQSQSGQEFVYVSPLAFHLEDIFALEAISYEEDESVWVNACVANYYHIDEVFVVEDNSDN